MKRAHLKVFFFPAALGTAFACATEPEGNTPEKLASGKFQIATNEVALLTSNAKPEERLRLLFTRFVGSEAIYKWIYFNPLTKDWVSGKGIVREVYDKVRQADGNFEVVEVPGHSTRIQAGSISVTWSRNNDKHGWIYFRPDNYTLEVLPARDFANVH